MNSGELLRLVDLMHREKNIPREVIFDGIAAAIQLAVEKHYGEEEVVQVTIDRDSGQIKAIKAEEIIDPVTLGRIAAQAAKQVMIQKIREAECNALYDEYTAMAGDLVHGTVQRFDGGAATVSLGKSEAILPRGEQIPGETHHVGERVKAVILEVKKAGNRVKIILSRTHPNFVRRLFEQEIPEIAERVIEIKALAREAGYRAKIAVSSIDLKVDCVGACVGVRGSRIKNIVDELGGERIDIVRWNDSLQVLIPNALQPAQIDEVFLYQRLGRAIVLVKEDQLSLAIGRRGQNVRLASKLVGWDIEIMTHDELDKEIDKSVGWFGQLPHATPEIVEGLITEGFLSFDDLGFLGPEEMAEVTKLSVEEAEELINFAEEAAKVLELEGPDAMNPPEEESVQIETSEAPAEALDDITPTQELPIPEMEPPADGEPAAQPEEPALATEATMSAEHPVGDTGSS